MKTGKENNGVSVALKIIKAVLIAWVVTLAVCVLATAMLAGGTIGEEMMGYAPLVALLLGAVSGSGITVRKTENGRLMQSLIFGTVFWLTLLCAGLILFDGQHEGIGVTALVAIGGSALASLINLPSGRNRNYGKRKYKISQLVQNAQVGK